MNSDNNPFKAPSARVADAAPDAGEFLPEGRRVPAGNGVAWLGQGWALFRQAPGPWIGIAVAFLAIIMVLSLIPGVSLVANLLMPMFVGGIMIGCKAQEDGDDLRFNHLFAGFSGHAGSLALVGVIYLAGMLAIFAVAAVVGMAFGVGVGLGGVEPGAGMVVGILVVALVALLLLIPLAMAVWYAPPLVVFHAVPPFEAMKTSFAVCLKNFVPFLVYGLVFLVLAILATIPMGLGWLVLMPVIYASVYASYRDMFTQA